MIDDQRLLIWKRLKAPPCNSITSDVINQRPNPCTKSKNCQNDPIVDDILHEHLIPLEGNRKTWLNFFLKHQSSNPCTQNVIRMMKSMPKLKECNMTSYDSVVKADPLLQSSEAVKQINNAQLLQDSVSIQHRNGPIMHCENMVSPSNSPFAFVTFAAKS